MTDGMAATQEVPLVYRQIGGTRPYVRVKLNGTPLLLMVHGNAGFSVMTTHANARKAGITAMTPEGQYGISQPGKVSPLGRASAVAKTFQVGGRTDHDLKIAIFEIPQTSPNDGMIGLPWLRQSKALIDFNRNRLVLPENEAEVQAAHVRLQKAGYIAHPMTWDDKDARYVVLPTINGVSGRFVVSTVADISIDAPFAQRAAVALGTAGQEYGGPTGTTGQTRRTQGPFAIVLDGQALHSVEAGVYDLYAYDGTTRPSDATLKNGYLGCDFMRANHAVIDFGAGILFLKPGPIIEH
ncbi:hypothetical protein CKY51_08490 [Xanthomonas maliensis]|nr:hypothetical protein CKY51_08490 [Xanthomonas maliensis]